MTSSCYQTTAYGIISTDFFDKEVDPCRTAGTAVVPSDGLDWCLKMLDWWLNPFIWISIWIRLFEFTSWLRWISCRFTFHVQQDKFEIYISRLLSFWCCDFYYSYFRQQKIHINHALFSDGYYSCTIDLTYWTLTKWLICFWRILRFRTH